MKIIILSHPLFFGSKSMPRFSNYLKEGLMRLDHSVEILRPKPYLSRLPFRGGIKKWLGYFDQYLVFSSYLFFRSRLHKEKSLFVLSDQALGIWAPIITSKAHVVHCHDFLALKSSKGQISDNPVGFTGRYYQALIFKGFSKAKNFISVSKNTMFELNSLLKSPASISTCVYNGYNPIFKIGNPVIAKDEFSNECGINLSKGYLLHVGGNQFYKNRIGLVKLYNFWRDRSNKLLPLILVGTPPDKKMKLEYEQSKYKKDIHFISGLSDDMVKKAYQGASAFIFPSLAEGFGWPIAEAMACGCPVITTNAAPMNEVGGEAAIYIENVDEYTTLEEWAVSASGKLESLLNKSLEERELLIQKGLDNVKRFDSEKTIDAINSIYTEVYNRKYN